MLDLMTRHWWALALRGAFAILFGIVAWAWPGITVWALVLLFGAYAMADGLIAVTHAIRGAAGAPRGLLLLVGVAGIALGIAALVWPGITAFALLMLIAAWAVATGILEIVVAIAMHKELRGEWVYVLTGAVSVLFGILLFSWPVSGAIAIVWLIGLLAILTGAAMLGAAFRLRRLGRQAERQGRTSPAARY
ncbi:HdeD family acid-resistance protein [Actinomadura chokoriensis]|uniref:HdeD family acid-resistance protein n=1 Tax=Actinomadura chokoriensis TaxID=454156 RepID=A0ABV4QXJ6_9ACTN